MNLKNSHSHYGWVSITLHWLMAIGLIGIYLLGIFMVDFDYYDPWYNKAPSLHKSLGIILTAMLLIRIVWIYSHNKPQPIETKKILKFLAKSAHVTLYLITLLLIISGYLISTAKGQSIDIFNLIELPAAFIINTEQAEFLGKAHDILASALMLMVALHTTAALIHHFIFKDKTLQRILWIKKSQ